MLKETAAIVIQTTGQASIYACFWTIRTGRATTGTMTVIGMTNNRAYLRRFSHTSPRRSRRTLATMETDGSIAILIASTRNENAFAYIAPEL